MLDDVSAIRLRNLRHLCGDKRGGRKDMADRLDMSESQLSQLIGKKPSKPIGTALARSIETKLKLPHGWLDTANHDFSQDTADFARAFQRLTPEQKRVLRDLIKNFQK